MIRYLRMWWEKKRNPWIGVVWVEEIVHDGSSIFVPHCNCGWAGDSTDDHRIAYRKAGFHSGREHLI